MTKLVSTFVTPSLVRLFILLYSLNSLINPTMARYRPGPSEPLFHHPPQITLTRYDEADSYRSISTAKQFPTQEEHFKNDFVARNGSEYIIYENTQAVTFSCEADYPITWNVPFKQMPGYSNIGRIQLFEFRSSQLLQNLATPVNKQYTNFIHILHSGIDFLSLSLSCSSTEITPALQASIYIYKSGKVSIENEGKTLTISANVTPSNSAAYTDNVPPLVIPCRPSSPETKLSLQKQISIQSKTNPGSADSVFWSPVKPSGKDVTFDPKVGFILERSLLGDRVFGFYRCFVTYSDEDYQDGDINPDINEMVFINVTQVTAGNQSAPDEEGGINFQEKFTVLDSASFEVTNNRFGKVKCCSGVANKPPNLYLRHCNSAVKCKLEEVAILTEESTPTTTKRRGLHLSLQNKVKLKSDCSQNLLFGTSAVVRCTGENVDILQRYVTVFHADAAGSVANRSQKLKSSETRLTYGNGKILIQQCTPLFKFEKSSVAEKVPVTRKILMLVGSPVATQPVGTTPNVLISESKSRDALSGNRDSDSLFILRLSYFFLREWDRDFYYEGEPLSFICVGIQSFYSFGAMLRLNWKNGTKSVLPTIDNNATMGGTQQKYHFMVYLSSNAQLPQGHDNGAVVVGSPVIANEDMASVDCFMPVIESSKWDKITKTVQILPSVAPTFVEAEEEEVYFYVGDTDRTLWCTVKEGTPFPDLKVTRDGSLLPFERKTKKDRKWRNGTQEREIKNEDEKVGQVHIHFALVKHSYQGVFQCTATNVNGTVTRTLKIFVIDKPNNTVPITLGIFGVLTLILVGLWVKHWLYKRRT